MDVPDFHDFHNITTEEGYMPKVYLIGEIDVHDADTYANYTAQTPDVIAKHGGKFIVRGGETETLEGEAPKGRVVVVEFPSLEAARAFYGSGDYQPLIQIRQSASSGRLFLVEGAE
jgi:uncharacterized protein (DUF1330 family)